MEDQVAGKRRKFGKVRRLPSGRWQASYVGPYDRRYVAEHTFDTEGDADTWLTTIRADMVRGLWTPPTDAKPTNFDEYATAWLAGRTLKPRTRDHYRRLLDARLLPTFGDQPVKAITADLIRRWHADQGDEQPTMRAHAYGLLRSILATAVHDGLLAANPCHIRGAGNSKRVHKIKPATLPELEALVAAMPERYQVMTLLAAWCGLRFGELTELRRKDLDMKNGVIHVRRAVVRVGGQVEVTTPKSDAGTRDVAIPPHLIPAIKEHLRSHISGGKDGLVFPGPDGGHLAPSSLYGRKSTKTKRGKVKRGWGFYYAREVAKRPDLRWHDLRHTGAVLAASTGATLAELMGRLGHSTPGAALRYQHAAEGRDAEIARRLSALVEGH
jgi:integrase